MALKLLTKSEISQSKAIGRALEVKEGVNLAKRVDSLREIVVQEEQALESFRIKTLEKIHEETTKAEQERAEIQQEVTRLRREREEARKPLDEEWIALKQEQRIYSDNKQDLEREFSKLEERINDHDTASKSLEQKEQKYLSDRILLNGLIQDANSEREQARAILANAQKGTQALAHRQEQVEQGFVSRETQISSSEKRQNERDKTQDAREVELNKRETRLADREQTLLRNKKRL